ncbi:MAG: SAM-dependent chlorinase/fluorinase, partial [Elusimicrobia bacterium]|nr:SAM-dependent chlorinase/fluorinase [Elusimicrobiota bacterium]
MGFPIVLLTDFGTQDPYVGILKGVILRQSSKNPLIDLTHEVPPQDVSSAAYILLTSFQFFPQNTLFMVVVDPGVGTRRKILYVRTARHQFLAPDNGVLTWALQKEDIHQILSVENKDLFLSPLSQTFHGRDIFAPVAAALAGGLPFSELGPPTALQQTLPFPQPQRHQRGWRGEVLHIDRFGNLVTNLTRQELASLSKPVLQIGRHRIHGLSHSYQETPKGKALALLGSSGFLELSLCQGNAQKNLRARRGTPVFLRSWLSILCLSLCAPALPTCALSAELRVPAGGPAAPTVPEGPIVPAHWAEEIFQKHSVFWDGNRTDPTTSAHDQQDATAANHWMPGPKSVLSRHSPTVVGSRRPGSRRGGGASAALLLAQAQTPKPSIWVQDPWDTPWRTEKQLQLLKEKQPSSGFRFAVVGDSRPEWHRSIIYPARLISKTPLLKNLPLLRGAPTYLPEVSERVFERFLEQIKKSQVDFTMHLGDLVTRGREEEYLTFLNQLSRRAPTPFLTTIGNHELTRAGPQRRVEPALPDRSRVPQAGPQ